MILEIDCGNSRIKWRCLPGRQRGSALWKDFESHGLAALALPAFALARIRMASVAARTQHLLSALHSAFAIKVELARCTEVCDGLRCGYLEPERLGVDRWLAVLAARRRFPGESLVVVDVGTAVTVDVVVGSAHRGGFIGPGLNMMRAALFSNTAAVQVPELARLAPTEPGQSTELAVTGALHLMILGLVDQARQRYAPAARVVVTGGDAVVLQDMASAVVVDELVLDGLAVALP